MAGLQLPGGEGSLADTGDMARSEDVEHAMMLCRGIRSMLLTGCVSLPHSPTQAPARAASLAPSPPCSLALAICCVAGPFSRDSRMTKRV
eukprot:1499859-Rhodomonas_salina.3